MKSFQLVTILLTISVCILAFLLYKKVQEREMCIDCRLEKPTKLPEYLADYQLKVKCSKNLDYQVFQYDLANGFSILGKLQLNQNDSTKIDKIAFKLYEAGNCNRYEIKDVKYEYNDECLAHVFNFQIEKRTSEQVNVFIWEEGFVLNNMLDVYPLIKSKDFININTYHPCDKNILQLIPEFANKPLADRIKMLRQFPPSVSPHRMPI